MSGLLARRARKAVAGGFDVETDLNWSHLYWAEGVEMVATAYADGDPVGSWPNEKDATVLTATSGLRPTYRSAYTPLDSKPAVEFDAFNDYMAASTLSTAPAYPATVVLIYNLDTTSVDRHITDGSNSSARNLVSVRNGSTRGMFAGSLVSGSSASTGAFLTLAYFSNSTSDYLNVNGTDEATGSSAGSHVYTTGSGIGYLLGCGNGFGQLFDGAISLFGFYNGSIKSDPAYADFKTWVTDYYGITLS